MADDSNSTPATPVPPVTPINNERLAKLAHVLAHTARILIVLKERPEISRAAEYKKQIRIYRGEWAQASDEEKVIVMYAVAHDDAIVDCDDATVAAAHAVLEED